MSLTEPHQVTQQPNGRDAFTNKCNQGPPRHKTAQRKLGHAYSRMVWPCQNRVASPVACKLSPKAALPSLAALDHKRAEHALPPPEGLHRKERDLRMTPPRTGRVATLVAQHALALHQNPAGFMLSASHSMQTSARLPTSASARVHAAPDPASRRSHDLAQREAALSRPWRPRRRARPSSRAVQRRGARTSQSPRPTCLLWRGMRYERG